MPYPEALVFPMREELTRLGFNELREMAQVDEAFDAAEEGTALLVINSVCGCAAANARPAVSMAMQAPQQPDHYLTVFAGQDLEATARVREYLRGIPPSSPFMVLLKDGDPVFLLERRHIEGRTANAIAMDLVNAYAKYCGTDATAEDGPESPDVAAAIPPTFRSFR